MIKLHEEIINPVTCPHCGKQQTDERGIDVMNLAGKRGLMIVCEKCSRSWVEEKKS